VFKRLSNEELKNDCIDFGLFQVVWRDIEFQNDVLRMLFDYFKPSEGKISMESVVKKLNDSYFKRHSLKVENPDGPQSGVAFIGNHRKCLLSPKKTLQSFGWADEVNKYKRMIATKFLEIKADQKKLISYEPGKIGKMDRKKFQIILNKWNFYLSAEMEEELFKTFSQGGECIDLKLITVMLKKIVGVETKYRLSL